MTTLAGVAAHPANDQLRPASRFLTAAELAAILGVSRRTLRRYVQQRLLRPVRLGRTIRFPESELRRLVAASDDDDPKV